LTSIVTASLDDLEVQEGQRLIAIHGLETPAHSDTPIVMCSRPIPISTKSQRVGLFYTSPEQGLTAKALIASTLGKEAELTAVKFLDTAAISSSGSTPKPVIELNNQLS